MATFVLTTQDKIEQYTKPLFDKLKEQINPVQEKVMEEKPDWRVVVDVRAG